MVQKPGGLKSSKRRTFLDQKPHALVSLLSFLLLVLSACSQSGSTPSQSCSTTSASVGGKTARAPVAYCPYIASPRTFASPVTVTGKAIYQYRLNGNGVVSNASSYALVPSIETGDYSVTISGFNSNTPFTCTSCTGYEAVRKIAYEINELARSSSSTIKATGSGSLVIFRTGGDNLNLTGVTGFDQTTSGHPIRHAEIRVTSTSGTTIEQCAETDSNGEFSLTLPANSGNYVVSVVSRASNTKNSAYVLKDPTTNAHYSVSTTVTTTGDSTVTLTAPATSTLEGGAFNILDQILNAQEYLREETKNCNQSGQSNYFPGCTPFTVAPHVNAYWAPGETPGKYIGAPGAGISFYLIGRSQLFILGGMNGNTSNSDTDHYDNSVILHEYAHFLEDKFAKPDSPGGSHSGNQAIDPRLAWGEGFANFFQGAVQNFPYYRDTIGHEGCAGTNCTYLAFYEPLDPADSNYKDKPTLEGEGNFREFSISRVLWQIVDMANTTYSFSEIWRNLAGTNSMKTSTDTMKTVANFHSYQQSNAGKTDWSSIVGNEFQSATREHYLTPITLVSGTCASSPIAMAVRKTSSDDGSFETSDQYRNNDFYIYQHPGGRFDLQLNWSGLNQVDLDLYLYRSGYAFGDLSSCSVNSYDYTSNFGTVGSEQITKSNLPAGTYVINVMAATREAMIGVDTTSYTLSLNEKTVCPSP